MDPPGLGANREGGNISEFERLGVTGPLGVEPSAGEPGDVAPPVVPEVEPAEPDPELDPPEPDDWALAEPTETIIASAATRCLCRSFIVS
jgi:hypothetical protein